MQPDRASRSLPLDQPAGVGHRAPPSRRVYLHYDDDDEEGDGKSKVTNDKLSAPQIEKTGRRFGTR